MKKVPLAREGCHLPQSPNWWGGDTGGCWEDKAAEHELKKRSVRNILQTLSRKRALLFMPFIAQESWYIKRPWKGLALQKVKCLSDLLLIEGLAYLNELWRRITKKNLWVFGGMAKILKMNHVKEFCDVFKGILLPDEKSVSFLCWYFASGAEIRGP